MYGYRGRYTLGVEVPLAVQTTDVNGNPAAPDACPTITVYTTAGARVSGWDTKKIPVTDRYGTATNASLFSYGLYLGVLFAAGRYNVVYQWAIGAFTGKQLACFDVIAGGDADGAIIAMTAFVKPHATFIVQHLDSGKLIEGKNPTV